MNLFVACTAVARQVLQKNGTASSDVVETLAQKFLAIAEDHQDFVRRERESDDVIALAVQYIAAVHAIPPSGTSTEWFHITLSTLMEVAVPNSVLDADSGKLLPCLQEGIRQSLAQLPVSRSSIRIEDEDAKTIRRMQDAGVEHGCTSDLLDLLERLFHGDPLSEEDQRLFFLSAMAAPITRNAREQETN